MSHRVCPVGVPQMSHSVFPVRVPQMSHSMHPVRVPQMSHSVCPVRSHKCPTVCAQWQSHRCPTLCPVTVPQMYYSAQMGSSTLCYSLLDMCSPVFLSRLLSIFLSVLAYMFTLRALFLSIASFAHIPRQSLHLKWYQTARGPPIYIVKGRMESMPIEDSVSLWIPRGWYGAWHSCGLDGWMNRWWKKQSVLEAGCKGLGSQGTI